MSMAGFGMNLSITKMYSWTRMKIRRKSSGRNVRCFFLQDYLSKCEIVDVNGGDILELQLKDSGEPVLAMVAAE